MTTDSTTPPRPPAPVSGWEDVRAPYGRLICRIDRERWLLEWVDPADRKVKVTVDLVPYLCKVCDT